MKLCPRTTELVSGIGSIKAAMFAICHRDRLGVIAIRSRSYRTLGSGHAERAVLLKLCEKLSLRDASVDVARPSFLPKTPRSRTASSVL